MNKQNLSERDICTKYINPALQNAGWDMHKQVREEVSFTDGRIIVQGKLHTRGKRKRADYILYYKPNKPIAIIEAKDNKHAVGDGMQQALEYAEILQIPFVFTSNGDSHVTVIRSFKKYISTDYLWIYTASPLIQNLVAGRVSGSTKQTELGTGTIKAMEFSLPPLEEQKAIVAKVNSLMALCDQLEQEVEQNAKQVEDLMQSCKVVF